MISSIAVRGEAEKQRKQYEIQQRIEKSKHLTAYRFALMKRRDEHMQHVRTLTLNKLRDVGKDKQKYSELLKYLLAQGLQTILEKDVTVQVRQEDVELVKKIIPQGIGLYQDVMKKASGITPKVEVKIDEKNFLPPAPKSDDDKQLTCTGGILLTAKNGQIVCKNTLDARYVLSYIMMLYECNLSDTRFL
jgi:V-type H+-transporting ATPase subunit E